MRGNKNNGDIFYHRKFIWGANEKLISKLGPDLKKKSIKLNVLAISVKSILTLTSPTVELIVEFLFLNQPKVHAE